MSITNVYKQVIDVAKQQVLAGLPPQYIDQFKESSFFNNVSRFSLQSTVILCMDTGLLAVYLVSHTGTALSLPFVATLLVKLLLMALSSFGLAKMSGSPYKPQQLLHRRIDILYPIFYAGLEMALFLAGPQDLGAFCRLLTVPFVVGSIPILSHAKSAGLLFLVYLAYFIYIPPTPYGRHILPWLSAYNFWSLAFLSSGFVSCTVYSWAVNSFLAKMRYQHFLAAQTMTNGVTLLPNRDKLKADIREILQAGQPGHILFLDVKQFSEINGYYGHSIGDKVLREVAHRLAKLAEETETIYNYDVDQFVFLASGADHQQAQVRMERIHQYFSTTPVLIGTLEIRTPLLIVAIPWDQSRTGQDEEQLMMDMDRAVHAAKARYKDEPYAFFDEGINQQTRTLYQRRQAMKKAVASDFAGFMLYYQPIINSQSGLCVGAEALLRWQDPSGEMVAPDDFIPALEQARLMHLVDDWVVHTALQQCGQWIRESGNDDFFVNVNLSSGELGRQSLKSGVKSAMQKNQLKQHNITLEITESFYVLGYKAAQGNLSSFREQGLQVAIDDFGTGYSSLSYLKTLPVNEVKIDRSFVKNIEEDAAARNFLLSIIQMIKSMDFIVCVEGLETAGQVELVRQTQAEFLQGHYFSQPLPPAAFTQQYLQRAC